MRMHLRLKFVLDSLRWHPGTFFCFWKRFARATLSFKCASLLGRTRVLISLRGFPHSTSSDELAAIVRASFREACSSLPWYCVPPWNLDNNYSAKSRGRGSLVYTSSLKWTILCSKVDIPNCQKVNIAGAHSSICRALVQVHNPQSPCCMRHKE